MKNIDKKMYGVTILCTVACILIFFWILNTAKHSQRGNYEPKEIVKEVTN